MKLIMSSCMIGVLLIAACLTAASPLDGKSRPGKKLLNGVPVVKVYYFHTRSRCATCKKIETWTREVVENKFVKEVKSGQLIYESICVSEREHAHFIDQYSLVSKSVVLSKVDKDNELAWKNLDQIWIKVRNRENFQAYIQESITNFMNQ